MGNMKINWRVRFQNKTFLVSLISLVIAFVYDLLNLFGIFPTVEMGALMNAVNMILTVLGMLGVVVDPTTAGMRDSRRALTYDAPWRDVG